MIAVLAVAVLASGGTRRLAPATTEINGIEVRGSRVLVFVDTSGSMPKPDVQVQRQLRALAAAGIPTDSRRDVNGSAISYTGTVTLLPAFLEENAAHPHVDTFYVISDYLDSADNRPAAIADFTEAIRTRGIRVYWASVNNDPPPLYHEIARTSGGAIIPPR